MNRNVLILCCVVFAGALVFLLWPDDEKEIRHNLDLLAEYCSSTPDEATLAMLKKVRKIPQLCTNPCAVEVELFPVKKDFSHKDIMDHVVMMKKMLPNTTFTFNDVTVGFPQTDSAVISSTLLLYGETKNQRFTDAYEMDVSAVKVDGDWLFSSFSIVEFMEK